MLAARARCVRAAAPRATTQRRAMATQTATKTASQPAHGFNVVGKNLAYPNFIDGKFVESKAKKFTDVHNPVCIMALVLELTVAF